MRKKDKSLVTAHERLKNHGTELKQKQTDLDSQAKFLEIEVANNNELDACIDELDRELVGYTHRRIVVSIHFLYIEVAPLYCSWQGKAREALGTERMKTLEALDEVDVVRNTLAKGANDLAQTSSENRIAKDNLDKLRWECSSYLRLADEAIFILSQWVSLHDCE